MSNATIHLLKEKINCKQCGKLTAKYRGSHYDRIKKFCSPECKKQWMRDNPELLPRSSLWKGENAGYGCKHQWIKRHYGNAIYCEYDKKHKAKRFEWANISGKYKRDISDYEMLCPSCHRKIDHIRRKNGL